MTAPALLSLWNGVDPARAQEYERWHTLEHVPERAWVPGFVSGTRYSRADADGPRFFTLYEIDGLACLESDAYRDLVDRPTPWSASMRTAFSGFVRKTGPVLATAGTVAGRSIAVSRLVWAQDVPISPEAVWSSCAADLLRVGAGVLVTRVRVQQAVPAGPAALRSTDRAPAGTEVLLIVELAAEDAGAAVALVAPALARAGVEPPTWREDSSFHFVSHVRHADVVSAVRPAPRMDLFSPDSGWQAG